MMVLENIYPQRVFYYFEKLSQIPHGSRNTKAISDYLVDFAKEHGLFCRQDDKNNVIIIKEASAGYEQAEPVIIQGHMDMVCEKEDGCDIDFERDGLRLYVDGDFVRAHGTTLGADDGIAVAYALALLESEELSHPKLEVVITVDEEIGMLGACGIDLSMLSGRTMLNIDSDEEGHFLTSCAGGMSVRSTIPVRRIPMRGQKLALNVAGLSGGHSGAEIHKGHGNADLIMGRLLDQICAHATPGICSLAGGLKDNAIPRACRCEILVQKENVNQIYEIVDVLNRTAKKEFTVPDPELTIQCQALGEAEEEVLDADSVKQIVFYLRAVPDGVQNMSQVMPGLVETSLNLGIIELKEDTLDTLTSVRSSVGSRKEDVKNRLLSILDAVGGKAEIEGDYPAWEYCAQSPLRDRIAQVYRDLYQEEPVFEAIHAGLECGLFSDKLPGLDCVSFGPWNYDIHTPKERLSISSTARVWDFIVELLKRADREERDVAAAR